MFNNTKLEYEEALKKYGHPTNLSYKQLNREQNNARKKRKTSNHLVLATIQLRYINQHRKNIFEFDRKTLLPLKIFNKDAVKVSCSCTQNMSQIIKRHKKRSERNGRDS